MEAKITEDLIEKLDHELEEVRLRWLYYIEDLTVTENVGDIALALIPKLVEWVTKYNHVGERIALNIILNLVTSDNSPAIVRHFGRGRLFAELQSVEKYLESQHLIIIDKILLEISKYPISSRLTDESVASERTHSASQTDTASSSVGFITERVSNKLKLHSDQSICNSENSSEEDHSKDGYLFILPWVHLHQKDCKILLKIAEDLKLGWNPDVVIPALNAFNNDILKNYPAEVVLQTFPLLEELFGLNTSKIVEIKSKAIQCLNLLTEKLVHRVSFYKDPATHVSTNYEILTATGKDFVGIRQLPIDNYCVSGLILSCRNLRLLKTLEDINLTLSLMDNLIHLTVSCLSKQTHFEPAANELAETIVFYREICGINVYYRMSYLRLLKMGITYSKYLYAFGGSDLYNALVIGIFDPYLEYYHIDLHTQLKQITLTFNHFLVQDYQKAAKLCQCLINVIEILKCSNKKQNVEDVLSRGDIVLPTLVIVRSKYLINILIRNCTESIEMKSSNPIVYTRGQVLFFHLISYPDPYTKTHVYHACLKQVKNAIGTSGSGKSGLNNVGIPITVDILIEIASQCTQRLNSEVSHDAEIIMILLLKSEMILSNASWIELKDMLVITFPIIQCLADKNSQLGNTIFEMLHPDVAENIGLEDIDIFKSNLRFLFCKNIDIRKEAISRLYYMLNREVGSDNLLPDANSLIGTISPSICVIQENLGPLGIPFRKPLEYFQPSSLQPLLEMLSTEGIDPSARRSSLLQLSVALNDSMLHPTFLKADGLNIIIQIFREGLSVKHTKDYPDSTIPAIAILYQICIYNKTLRMELSGNTFIIYSVLRVLLMFHDNLTFRVDCVRLLFLFCWTAWINKCPNEETLVHTALKRIFVPFVCDFDTTDRHTTEIWPVQVINKDICYKYVRFMFTAFWFNGLDRILKWKDMSERDKPIFSESSAADAGNELYQMKLLKDINCLLLMTDDDLKLAKLTSTLFAWELNLNQIENATCHEDVKKAVNTIKCIIPLGKAMPPLDLFKNSIKRFITSVPTNTADKNMLQIILNLIREFLKLEVETDSVEYLNWVINVLNDSNRPLLNTLKQIDMENLETVFLNQELLTLITECVKITSRLRSDFYLLSTKTFKQKSNILPATSKKQKSKDTVNERIDIEKVIKVIIQAQGTIRNIREICNIYQDNYREIEKIIIGKYEQVAEKSSVYRQREWSGVLKNLLLVIHSCEGDYHKYLVYRTNLMECLSVVIEEIKIDDVKLFKKIIKTCIEIIWEIQNRKSNSEYDDRSASTSSQVPSEHDAVVESSQSSETHQTDPEYTGVACIRYSLIILSNILERMQKTGLQWESFWLDTDTTAVCLQDLTCSQDLCVRSGSLQIISGLGKTPSGCEELMNALNYIPGELWTSMFNLFFNHDECPLVRYHVGCFLVNITSHMISNTDVKSLLSPKPSDNRTSKQHPLLQLFHRIDFYKHAITLIKNLHIQNIVENTGWFGIANIDEEIISSSKQRYPESPLLDYYCVTMYNKYHDFESVSNTTQDIEPVIATPDVVKCLTQIIWNIMRIVPETVEIFYECHIFMSLFKCLQSAYQTSNFTLALLQMFSEICTLMSEVVKNGEYLRTFLQEQRSINGLVALVNMDCYGTLPHEIRDNILFQVLNLVGIFSATLEGSAKIITHLEETSPTIFLYALRMVIADSTNKALKQAAMTVLFELLINDTNPLIFHNMLDLAEVYFNDPTHSKISVREHITCVLSGEYLKLVTGNLNYVQIILDAHKVETSYRHTLMATLGALCYSTEMLTFNLHQVYSALITHLKELHMYLSSSPTDALKKFSEKKCYPIVADLKKVFKLLASLFANKQFLTTQVEYEQTHTDSTEHLKAFCILMHKLWPYCLSNKELLILSLDSLCNYSSEYSPALSFLASPVSSTYAHAGGFGSATSTSRSVLMSIIQLVQKQMAKLLLPKDTMKLALIFIEHCSLAAECRQQIIQSEVLELCKIPSNKRVPLFFDHWLQILKMITRGEDGQTAVAKSVTCRSTLFSGFNTKNDAYRPDILEIIRNITFNTSNRSILINSAEYLEILSSVINEGDLEEKTMILLCVWSIISNNHKAKTVIKNHMIFKGIKNLNQLQSSTDNDSPAVIEQKSILSYVLQIFG